MTTIQVSKESRDRWKAMKNHPQESYEDMINRMFAILAEDADVLTRRDLSDIEQSLQEIKRGEFVTNEQLIKERNL